MFVAIRSNNCKRVMNFRAMMGNNNGGAPEKVQPALCGLAIVRRLAPGLATAQCGKTQQSCAEQHRGSGFRDRIGVGGRRRQGRGGAIDREHTGRVCIKARGACPASDLEIGIGGVSAVGHSKRRRSKSQCCDFQIIPLLLLKNQHFRNNMIMFIFGNKP
jgi:hypothetical protein